MNKVYIYTDGACHNNPGPGGYCAILKYGIHEKIISGNSSNTTNNIMELSAVLEGLKALKKPCDVTIITDSKYICDTINLKWIDNWKSNGWKRPKNKPVLNVEIWMEIDKLLNYHKVTFEWIKGHSGHPYNEKCDKIAVAEYQKYL